MFGNRERLKPSELANAWGVSVERVLGWIRQGSSLRRSTHCHRGEATSLFDGEADLRSSSDGGDLCQPAAPPVARQQRDEPLGGTSSSSTASVVRRIYRADGSCEKQAEEGGAKSHPHLLSWGLFKYAELQGVLTPVNGHFIRLFRCTTKRLKTA